MPPTLTARESEVMDLVTRGLSNQEIARDLYISVKTVKNHLNHAFAKLSARSRTEAVAVWLGPMALYLPKTGITADHLLYAITVADAEADLGRPLRDGEAERISEALPRSTIPEAFSTVLDAFRKYDKE